nr:MAG TPA: hypothetical protein [Caudoviricetes sp.]
MVGAARRPLPNRYQVALLQLDGLPGDQHVGRLALRVSVLPLIADVLLRQHRRKGDAHGLPMDRSAVFAYRVLGAHCGAGHGLHHRRVHLQVVAAHGHDGGQKQVGITPAEDVVEGEGLPPHDHGGVPGPDAHLGKQVGLALEGDGGPGPPDGRPLPYAGRGLPQLQHLGGLIQLPGIDVVCHCHSLLPASPLPVTLRALRDGQLLTPPGKTPCACGATAFSSVGFAVPLLPGAPRFLCVQVGHIRLRQLELGDHAAEGRVVIDNRAGDRGRPQIEVPQHHEVDAQVVLGPAGGALLRLRHPRLLQIAHRRVVQPLQGEPLLRGWLLDAAVGQQAGHPRLAHGHGLAPGLGQRGHHEALVHDQVAAHHGVAQDGQHPLHGLDGLIHPHSVVSKQSQLVVHGVSVHHGLDVRAPGRRGGQGGQLGADGIGDDGAALPDDARIGIAGVGDDVEEAPLLVGSPELTQGLEILLVQVQPAVSAQLLVAAVGEHQVGQQIRSHFLHVEAGEDGAARHVLGVLDAVHIGCTLAVAVEDHLHRIPAHGPHGHGEHLRVIVGRGQSGDVAVHIAGGGQLIGGNLGHAEGGVVGIGAGGSGGGAHLGAAGVELADDIGLQEGGHAGQILHVHLVDDGPHAVAQGITDVGAGPGGLGQGSGGQGDRLLHRAGDKEGLTHLLDRERYLPALHQVVAPLRGLVPLLGRVNRLFHELPVLLLNQALQILDLAVEVPHLVHLGPVLLPLPILQETLSLFHQSSSVLELLRQLPSHVLAHVISSLSKTIFFQFQQGLVLPVPAICSGLSARGAALRGRLLAAVPLAFDDAGTGLGRYRHQRYLVHVGHPVQIHVAHLAVVFPARDVLAEGRRLIRPADGAQHPPHRQAHGALPEYTSLDGGDGGGCLLIAEHIAPQYQPLHTLPRAVFHSSSVHPGRLIAGAPVVIQQHRPAHVPSCQLRQGFIGESLMIPVHLIVTGGQAEGEHLFRLQLPQGLCVDQRQLILVQLRPAQTGLLQNLFHVLLLILPAGGSPPSSGSAPATAGGAHSSGWPGARRPPRCRAGPPGPAPRLPSRGPPGASSGKCASWPPSRPAAPP